MISLQFAADIGNEDIVRHLLNFEINIKHHYLSKS